MLLSKAAESYEKFRIVGGFANATIKNDQSTLRRLIRVVGDIDTKKITTQHIDRFFESFADNPRQRYEPGTINQHHGSLSAFLRWCRARGHMRPDIDPLAGRRYQPQPRKARARVAMADFPRLLDSADHPRDRMLLACGLYLLGRQSEIVNLRIRDVDFQSREIHMTIFKSKIYDQMPISQELHGEIVRWFEYYQEKCGPLQPDWYLVPALSNTYAGLVLRPTRKMSKPEDNVKKALAAVGVQDRHLGMHCLRRSAARALFDEMTARGYDGALRRVSAWLHHSSVTITEGYLGLDIDRAQRDNDSKGKPLFPSLVDENVIDLRSRRNGEADAVGL